MAVIYAASDSSLHSVELDTGNSIKLYKQCEAAEHGLCMSTFGLLVAQKDKPLLLQYGKKETQLKKVVLPEKINCISVSPCQNWLVAGAQSGRILVWNLNSAELVFARDAHFQSVTAAKFTDDSAVLVSGGKDGRILIWRLFDLIVPQESVDPTVLTSHTLAISDLVLSKGSWREARIYSSSLDSTICIHQVANAQRLTTLTTPAKVRTLAVDPVERAVYAAEESGVRVIPLYRLEPRTNRLQAVGGGGDVVSCDDCSVLETPSGPTALDLRLDATNLAVGDAEGVVSIWDIGTLQLVRKLKPIKGAVTNLIIFNEPLDPKELPSLQRILSDAADVTLDGSTYSYSNDVSEQDIADIYSKSTKPIEVKETSNGELESLKKEYQHLKQLYDKLWSEHQQYI